MRFAALPWCHFLLDAQHISLLQLIRCLQVWHNYGFDRHMMRNKFGIECRGFAGDTMHMARLWDSSRAGKGYSLQALSSDLAPQLADGSTARSKTSMKVQNARS